MFYFRVPILLLLGFVSCPVQEIAKCDTKSSGYEPAGFGSLSGVAARIFNSLTYGADHLFYYHTNLYGNDQDIDGWIQYAGLLGRRSRPVIDVAGFYPDTANKLSDAVLRYSTVLAFFPRAQALRQVTDCDFVSEQMILDGALSRYKVLVLLWERVVGQPVLKHIDQWPRAGGTIIYPARQQVRQGLIGSAENDRSISRRGQDGDTGEGHVIFYEGTTQPLTAYYDFVLRQLRNLPQIRPEVRRGLAIDAPAGAFWSILSHGGTVLLNFRETDSNVRLQGGKELRLRPLTISIL